jgi:uncharacterized protein (DUF697 family)
MKKVLVVVGIIISAVIISGIIVGLGKNEKTLFNEKIETDNNVLISCKYFLDLTKITKIYNLFCDSH